MLAKRYSNRYILIGLLALCSAISLGIYLFVSDWIFRIGYPLDDAWIHQTYARNLAATGTWTYIPGQVSAGSTAPAWSLLLALGYRLNLDPYFWTYFLGWVVLSGLAITAAFGFKLLAPSHPEYAIWAGLLVIFEWHMTWAAVSGMETLLFALIALIVLLWIIWLKITHASERDRFKWHWFGMGLLIGSSVWIRPDGITLLPVSILTLSLLEGTTTSKLKLILYLIAGFALTAAPYLLFNQILAGEFWPNTFYAKQAEYAVLRNLPIWQRVFNVSRQPLTGIGIILLPGFIWFGIQSIRERNWAYIFSFTWVIGYLGLYAWRLPVDYQHGRYIMPIIPAFILFGMAGLVRVFDFQLGYPFKRIMQRSWVMIAGIVLIAFWILGGRAYAMDVAVIETEMVETANWIADHTEENSLIAAHDIGALGYFSDRNFIDLAGLVSPEVIPFIRDEIAINAHIEENGANYLMTFPGWYPILVRDKLLVYQSEGEISPNMGGENMSVYELETQ